MTTVQVNGASNASLTNGFSIKIQYLNALKFMPYTTKLKERVRPTKKGGGGDENEREVWGFFGILGVPGH